MEVPERHVNAHPDALAAWVRLGAVWLVVLAAGCASGSTMVETSRYTLRHPEHWQVQSVAPSDGKPTVVVVEPYAQAVIDQGSGATAPRSQNYDAVTAPVELRLYTWPDPGLDDDPVAEVSRLLHYHADLELPAYARVPLDLGECGQDFRRKYRLAGQEVPPQDLLRRARSRIVLIGARAPGVLIGVLGRVAVEGPDEGRYCHNLRNLQVQVQNALDGFELKAGSALAPAIPAPPPL